MSDDTRHDRDTWPSPGQYEPPPWEEYRGLRQAVHEYIDHEPDDPDWVDIWRALAAIMSAYQRQQFLQAFGLDEPAEVACIRRLITDGDECPHSPGSDTEHPHLPHEPPASDNATLWLADGDPALFSMHVTPDSFGRLRHDHQQEGETPADTDWLEIFEFAAEQGLEVSVLPTSWYEIGSTVQIVLYPPERY